MRITHIRFGGIAFQTSGMLFDIVKQLSAGDDMLFSILVRQNTDIYTAYYVLAQ